MQLRNDQLLFMDTSKYPLPNGIVPCLMCTKPFIMGLYTGEPDQVCPECWDTYRDCARVVCKRCKVTIGRVPVRTLDNGYQIQPRSILHSDCCNICRPGLKESTILEIAEWQKQIRQNKIIVSMR